MEEENVILCAGDYPKHELPLWVLRNAHRIVCCDGAAVAYMANEGREPWRIVGDGDSLPPDFQKRHAAILTRMPDQDTNDQTKATRFLMSQGIRKMAYLGATGGREDHALGNISLLIEYMRWGLDVRMYTDHGYFVPCRDAFRALLPIGTQISIFSFGAQQLTAQGLKWQLSDFTNWWMGTLNEVVDEKLSITASGDFLVFVNYPSPLCVHGICL